MAAFPSFIISKVFNMGPLDQAICYEKVTEESMPFAGEQKRQFGKSSPTKVWSNPKKHNYDTIWVQTLTS